MVISAQISRSETACSLLGEVARVEPTAVVLQTPREEYQAELATAGMFRLDTVPAGPVRLWLPPPRVRSWATGSWSDRRNWDGLPAGPSIVEYWER